MKLNQASFAALVLKMTANKEALQARIDSGAKMVELAAEHGVSVSSFRSVFRIIGLKKRIPQEDGGSAPITLRRYMDGTNAIALVVARIARELNVNCHEVTEFLNGGK